ncbi:hypothetical protein [Amycolatopsis sp. cmx-4-68]|uniref:hypothetical protein n=1 Tax=Amycolatopsis sp. cmx-4-68 TaxID=2790938 RepID=UPI00397C64BC
MAGATVALLAATAGSAMAYPLSHFGPYTGTSGKTEGNITWYNRAVGVQGYVTDFVGGPTTSVIFFFFQGDSNLGSTSRYADSKERSINFTQDGPSGGITKVEVWLCNNSETCVQRGTILRP